MRDLARGDLLVLRVPGATLRESPLRQGRGMAKGQTRSCSSSGHFGGNNRFLKPPKMTETLDVGVPRAF